MNINNKRATDSPELAATLIGAIGILQTYIKSLSGQVSVNELWKYKIGDLKKMHQVLTNEINDVIE